LSHAFRRLLIFRCFLFFLAFIWLVAIVVFNKVLTTNQNKPKGIKMSSDPLKKTRRKIQDAMDKNGIATLSELHRLAQGTVSTKCSHMHYRRPFDDKYTGAPNLAVLIEMAFVAGCSKKEIIEIARNFGDRLWPQLIDPELGPREKTTLRVIKDLTALDFGMWSKIANSLGQLCRIVGLNRDKELEQLKE
jgi:hypothetical protein